MVWKIHPTLLELFTGYSIVRDRQFEYLVSDPANKGRWRFVRGDHIDLRRRQFGGCADCLSGGFFSDRWARRGVLLLSFIIFFIAYLGFARAKSVPLIATLFAFYGLFQGMFRSVGKAFASDFVPERLRASGVGWYNTTVGLLGLVANIVAGLLWDRIDHAAVFYYGATFAIMGSMGLLVLVPGDRTTTPSRRPE